MTKDEQEVFGEHAAIIEYGEKVDRATAECMALQQMTEAKPESAPEPAGRYAFQFE